MATFIGYVIATLLVLVFYYGTGFFQLPRVKTVLGMSYVALKVRVFAETIVPVVWSGKLWVWSPCTGWYNPLG